MLQSLVMLSGLLGKDSYGVGIRRLSGIFAPSQL